jgi:hypothetical protein
MAVDMLHGGSSTLVDGRAGPVPRSTLSPLYCAATGRFFRFPAPLTGLKKAPNTCSNRDPGLSNRVCTPPHRTPARRTLGWRFHPHEDPP